MTFWKAYDMEGKKLLGVVDDDGNLVGPIRVFLSQIWSKIREWWRQLT